MDGFDDIFDYNQDFGIEFDEYSIEGTREEYNQVIEFFQSLPEFEPALLSVAEARELDPEFLRSLGCFFIPEESVKSLESYPAWIKQSRLGIFKSDTKVPLLGRFVYPIRNIDNVVIGFCGWDKFEEAKYLDSKNSGYKAKYTTFFGMEQLKELYYNKEILVITEGIVDAIWIRQQGICSGASLGSHLTSYVLTIFKRLGSRLIVIPDNDEAGDGYVRQIKRHCPKAIVLQPKGEFKDLDDMRKGLPEENEAIANEIRSLKNIFVVTPHFTRR